MHWYSAAIYPFVASSRQQETQVGFCGKLSGMSDLSNVPTPRDARGRLLARPANSAPVWQKGQSGNPSGRNGLYGEMLRRAREFTPEATDYLIAIARDGNEDTRNRIVAIQLLFDRAWGKPQASTEGSAEPEALRNLSPEQRLRRVHELLAYAASLPVRGASLEADTSDAGDE